MVKWGEAYFGDKGERSARRLNIFHRLWFFFTDKEFRRAVKTKREIDQGKTVMHVVGEVEGMQVVIPETMIVAWKTMPEEVRAEIMIHLAKSTKDLNEGESRG